MSGNPTLRFETIETGIMCAQLAITPRWAPCLKGHSVTGHRYSSRATVCPYVNVRGSTRDITYQLPEISLFASWIPLFLEFGKERGDVLQLFRVPALCWANLR